MIRKINGKEFDVSAEPADFWGWVEAGHYRGEWEVLDKAIRSDHTFIDLGAWVGSHSLYASTIAHRVIALEPDPVARRILLENTRSVPTIEVSDIAISDRIGVQTLGSGFLGASTTRINPDAGGGIGKWEEGQTFEARTTTLRDLVERRAAKDPLFIKIDVEGAEELIVRDFEFFKEHFPTVYLETHPFWWKNPTLASADMNALCRLYGQPANVFEHCGHLLLEGK